jgi:predicted nucleotidyltransferase
VKTLDLKRIRDLASWQAALREFTRRARAELGELIVRIVLYGSRARGDFDDDSDIDVLVVVRRIDRDEAHDSLSAIAYEVNAEFGEFIVLLVITDDWYNSRRDFSFYRSVGEDSIPL